MWSTGVETGAGPHSFQAAPLTGPLLEPKQAGLLLPDTQHQPSKAKQVWQAFYTDSIKIFHPLENLCNWHIVSQVKGLKREVYQNENMAQCQDA